MIAWCLIALARASSVSRVVIAAPEGFEDELAEAANASAPSLELRITSGGATRSESVARGVEAAGEVTQV